MEDFRMVRFAVLFALLLGCSAITIASAPDADTGATTARSRARVSSINNVSDPRNNVMQAPKLQVWNGPNTQPQQPPIEPTPDPDSQATP
jgi:hypothetical protein